MITVDVLLDTIIYIANGSNFWASMGSTFSTGMVIGSLLYNGDLKLMQKGTISITTYMFFILFTTVSRIYARGMFKDHVQSYAGIITILVVSLFYVTGMYFGVLLLSIIKKRKYNKQYDNPTVLR